LLTSRDYSKVFNDVQVRVPHRHLLILATPNSLDHARVGLVFSKKNLRRAVQRNRIKRLVRETFRQRTDLPAYDVVVIGRQGLKQIENPQLIQILDEMWTRLQKKSVRVGQQNRQSAVG